MTLKKDARILVIDDEDHIRDIVRQSLERLGYQMDEAADGKSGLAMIRQYPYPVIVTDVRLPGLAGDQILQEAVSLFPETIVILMTGFATVESAVEAMSKGAYYYLQKDGNWLNTLILSVERGLQHQQLGRENQQLRRENQILRAELQEKYRFSDLVGDSAAIQDIYKLIRAVASKNSNVLIQGETGTGKELIARAIHHTGPRRDQPLVCVNCAAIPSNLLEDELFGHVKGAFTGAHQHRIGRFEQADNGTLFLDEISSMPMELQAKMLRVIQEREFQRLGSGTTIKVDVRLIAATNINLLEAVEKGDFREDLYYRLNVIPVNVPPLRDRRKDIPPMVRYFVEKYCREQNLGLKTVSNKAYECLMAYEWPGNVRQLGNAVEMAVTLSEDRDVLDLEDFPYISGKSARGDSFQRIDIPDEGLHFNTMMSNLEKQLILQSLEASGGNKKRAASLLHMKRTTFVEKLRRMGAEPSGDKPEKG
jgi:DNA-binding NtrC family response regulator